MKLRSLIALRPVCFFIILALIMLLIPSFIFPFWVKRVKRVEQEVKSISLDVHQKLLSEIEDAANLLLPMNSSATNLARVLSSSLNGTELSFSDIQNKVAPALFQALSTIPHLSQISYIGLNGLFFSHYTDGDQAFAVYSNSSFSQNVTLNAAIKYSWYIQPINRDTGKLYGEAVISPPWATANSSWIQEALNSINGHSSLGTVWNNAQNLLFLNTAGVDGRGVVSLGFSVKSLIGVFSGINRYGVGLFLSTKEGNVLDDGIPNTHMVLDGNAVSFQLLKPNGDQIDHVGNVTCEPNDGTLRPFTLKIRETKYMFYCSLIEIVGVQSVYVLAIPKNELEGVVHKNIKLAFVFLGVMIVIMVISIVVFMLLTIRAARSEMHLCAALIKQMEATQQAERKSMNKSLAFASASHDVRASLAGITGLIEICHNEVPTGSELDTNLLQMEACTKDLLGILNSILDTSKIEAGKMQLEEEEFDLAQLLEDIIDLYHPVGMKRGVDVVLDPCDGSVSKFSYVKGDRGKLKQILSNLLSNAVKFTSEGHVSVRACAKKMSFENAILASNQSSSLNCLSCLVFKNDKAYNDLEVINTIQQNQNLMEFVFEVDDTGKGIPKEKQKSVFENYVQVKETTLGEGGTGLGLGIVQSLVRLMGGEIGIVDKEIGYKGTCFRFNAFLSTLNTDSNTCARDEDIESHRGYISSDSYQQSGPSTTRAPSPRREGSQIVLFIQSNERQRTSQKFMESLGIEVSAINQLDQLPHTLKKIKQKLNLSHCNSSSRRSDISLRSDCMSRAESRNSSARTKNVPLSALDGRDHDTKGVPNFIVIILDISAGPFRELSKAVAEFRRDLCNTCLRVIWIDKPGAHNIQSKGLDEDKLPPTDLIISKPFHGSRLYHIIGLLPEFGGTIPGILSKARKQSTCTVEKVAFETGCSGSHTRGKLKSVNSPEENLSIQWEGKAESGGPSSGKFSRGKKISVSYHNLPTMFGDIQEHSGTRSEKPSSGKKVTEGPSSGKSSSGKKIPVHASNLPIQFKEIQRGEKLEYGSPNSEKYSSGRKIVVSAQNLPVQQSEIQEDSGTRSEKPLMGKKVMVAEDSPLLRKLAMSNLSQLGATVELCENGQEALELVCTGLNEQRKHGASIDLPFDYILMDCEMPEMDGYEATRRIRKEERYYGVHTPIIALTAHSAGGEETNRMIEAGMDFHLSKPLRKEQLLEAIRQFH